MQNILRSAWVATMGVCLASSASAQIVPARPLDAPPTPLAGPPTNQPARQLPPEADTISDPALVSARNPGPSVGVSKTEQACARMHVGYDPATRSYVDDHGRQHTCG